MSPETMITIGALIFAAILLLLARGKARDSGVPDTISGVVRRVVDGDSLYIEGVKPQIRLWGVDAPETYQRGYAEARALLTDLALGAHVTCDVKDVDRHGRIVARCFLPNGEEANQVMIESGLAREYLKFTKGFYGGA